MQNVGGPVTVRYIFTCAECGIEDVSQIVVNQFEEIPHPFLRTDWWQFNNRVYCNRHVLSIDAVPVKPQPVPSQLAFRVPDPRENP